MRYLNVKTQNGVETVDQLDPNDFETFAEFRSELKRLTIEYHMAGINVYSSQRCCKEWND